MDKQQVINKIRQLQGHLTQKAFALSLGISQQYLCDIYKGRRDPGPTILKAVGIKDKGKVYE